MNSVLKLVCVVRGENGSRVNSAAFRPQLNDRRRQLNNCVKLLLALADTELRLQGEPIEGRRNKDESTLYLFLVPLGLCRISFTNVRGRIPVRGGHFRGPQAQSGSPVERIGPAAVLEVEG